MSQGQDKNFNEKVKALELELARLKKEHEHVIRIIPSALFTVDKEKRILSWNMRAEEITGYKASEMIGQACSYFSEEPCKDQCGLYDSPKEKPLYGRECIVKCKDGKFKVISKNVDFVRDEFGNVIGGIESFEDVTDLKDKEKKLHDQAQLQEYLVKERTKELVGANNKLVNEIETRLKLAGMLRRERDRVKQYLNVAGVIILMLSDAYEISMINKKGCEVLGYDEREVLYQNWIEAFVPQEERLRTCHALDSLMKGNSDDGTIFYEGSIVNSKEEERLIAWTNVLIKEEDPRASYVLVSGMDITDLRKKEKLLQESEIKFRSLVETSGDFIWEITPDLIYTYASHQIEELLGYAPAEVIGHKVEDFMDEVEGKRVTELIRQYIKEEKSFRELETERKHKDGHVIVLETTGIPIYDDEKKLLCYRGIAHDVTARKRHEEEIIDSKDMLLNQKILLEKKNIALQEILGHIEEEKKGIEERVLRNIQRHILPNLKQLELRGTEVDKKYIAAIEKDFANITSSFSIDAVRSLSDLTPRELEVCNWIKKGLTTKEIAEILNLSTRTVETHRNTIRKKLGISGNKANLAKYI